MSGDNRPYSAQAGTAENPGLHGQAPPVSVPPVPPPSARSGTVRARRPAFTFRFRAGHHVVMVDVFSLVDGEFALFAGWGGRFRRLPQGLAARVEISAGVLERAFDAERDLHWSKRLDAAGL